MTDDIDDIISAFNDLIIIVRKKLERRELEIRHLRAALEESRFGILSAQIGKKIEPYREEETKVIPIEVKKKAKKRKRFYLEKSTICQSTTCGKPFTYKAWSKSAKRKLCDDCLKTFRQSYNKIHPEKALN